MQTSKVLREQRADLLVADGQGPAAVRAQGRGQTGVHVHADRPAFREGREGDLPRPKEFSELLLRVLQVHPGAPGRGQRLAAKFHPLEGQGQTVQTGFTLAAHVQDAGLEVYPVV